MDLLRGSGVFHTRECKLCNDGVVVMGEYGMSSAVLKAGYNIATLMSMCASFFIYKASPLQAHVQLSLVHMVDNLHGLGFVCMSSLPISISSYCCQCSE